MEKFQLVQRENGEEKNKKDDIYAYRTREEILAAERTVAVTYEQKLYERDLKTFVKGVEKRKEEFEELKTKIGGARIQSKVSYCEERAR